MSIANHMEDIFSGVFSSLTKKADHYVHRIKRNIMLSLLQYVFMGVGLVCITIAIMLLLRRYIAIEWILLILGVLALYTGIMLKLFRR